MVLILSACVAVMIERYRERTGSAVSRIPWLTVIITLVFLYTAVDIMIGKSEGLIISMFFIGAIMGVSIISRCVRSDELRVVRFQFANNESKFRWNTLQHLEIPVLAPHRPGGRTLDEKERELRRWHHLADEIPVVFVEISLGDTSDFFQEPMLDIRHEGGRYIIRVSRCTSIAPAIAAGVVTDRCNSGSRNSFWLVRGESSENESGLFAVRGRQYPFSRQGAGAGRATG